MLFATCANKFQDFSKRDTSSLVNVGGGGAPTPVSQVSKVAKKFERAAPGLSHRTVVFVV